jgi:predicted site-specific integrase-resolvase
MTIDSYIKLKRMTHKKAAEELGVNYTTLYRWIKTGIMPKKPMLKKINEWSEGAVTANDFTS